MDTIELKSFDNIGVAIKYPIELSTSGRPLLVNGSELVNQSIITILTTLDGTYFNQSFRCRLKELQFEQNSEILVSLLDTFIRESIIKFEKRTKLLDVQIEQDSETGILNCNIYHQIIGEKEVSSVTFPFVNDILNF